MDLRDAIFREMRSRRPLVNYLVVVVLLLASSPYVMAQVAPEFKLAAASRLKVGEPLVITVEVSQTLKVLQATLLRNESAKALGQMEWRQVQAARAYRMKQSLPPGKHVLKLVLLATTAQGQSRIEFPLNVSVISPMRIRVSKTGLNAGEGRLTLVAQSQISQARIEIFDRTGAMADQRTTRFGAQDGTGDIDLRFDPIESDRVFRLELSIEDSNGQWKRFKFVRWFAEIPHEDVIFENGQWGINPEEAKKLDRAIQSLNAEVDAFRVSVGRADVDFDVSLYVGGMTDTVGTKADNQRLSSSRATAIAAYFRKHGLSLPIYVAGFGEAGLRTATADEVAEPRNRRAIYVLTSGTYPNLTPPSGQWQKY